MPEPTTTEMLAEAVKASGLRDEEIARQLGLAYSHMVTMMRQGLVRVPLGLVPDLSRVLGLDAATFLGRLLAEYATLPAWRDPEAAIERPRHPAVFPDLTKHPRARFGLTAMTLDAGIRASKLPLREIADRIGVKTLSALEDMRNGMLMIQLLDLPAIARTLDIEERNLILIAIEEYHPGIMEILHSILGLPRSEAEVGILTMFRMFSLRGNSDAYRAFVRALDALLELAPQIEV